MSLKLRNPDLYLKSRVSDIESHFLLYEIHSTMIEASEEAGKKTIYIYEYPLTIKDAKKDIQQRKERIIRLRDTLLKVYPNAIDLFTEKRLLDL